VLAKLSRQSCRQRALEESVQKVREILARHTRIPPESGIGGPARTIRRGWPVILTLGCRRVHVGFSSFSNGTMSKLLGRSGHCPLEESRNHHVRPGICAGITPRDPYAHHQH
jgi:hypothetical protein